MTISVLAMRLHDDMLCLSFISVISFDNMKFCIMASLFIMFFLDICTVFHCFNKMHCIYCKSALVIGSLNTVI